MCEPLAAVSLPAVSKVGFYFYLSALLSTPLARTCLTSSGHGNSSHSAASCLGTFPSVIMGMSAWERFPLGLGTFPVSYWHGSGPVRRHARGSPLHGCARRDRVPTATLFMVVPYPAASRTPLPPAQLPGDAPLPPQPYFGTCALTGFGQRWATARCFVLFLVLCTASPYRSTPGAASLASGGTRDPWARSAAVGCLSGTLQPEVLCGAKEGSTVCSGVAAAIGHRVEGRLLPLSSFFSSLQYFWPLASGCGQWHSVRE